jgi:hypothetical protein
MAQPLYTENELKEEIYKIINEIDQIVLLRDIPQYIENRLGLLESALESLNDRMQIANNYYPRSVILEDIMRRAPITKIGRAHV